MSKVIRRFRAHWYAGKRVLREHYVIRYIRKSIPTYARKKIAITADDYFRMKIREPSILRACLRVVNA